MKMQESDFRRALEIITRNNRITVSFNTPIADNYSQVYPLLIHESNASVLKQLHEAGFSMSMTKKGLEVSIPPVPCGNDRQTRTSANIIILILTVRKSFP